MRKKCIHAEYGKKRGPYPNAPRERVDFKFKDEAARARSLMRHSWYRRLRAKQALA